LVEVPARTTDIPGVSARTSLKVFHGVRPNDGAQDIPGVTGVAGDIPGVTARTSLKVGTNQVIVRPTWETFRAHLSRETCHSHSGHHCPDLIEAPASRCAARSMRCAIPGITARTSLKRSCLRDQAFHSGHHCPDLIEAGPAATRSTPFDDPFRASLPGSARVSAASRAPKRRLVGRRPFRASLPGPH
jgi:hypothetical protein